MFDGPINITAISAFNEALRLHSAGALDDAAAAYERAIAADPAYAQALVNLSALRIAQKNFAAAESAIAAALAADPAYSPAWCNRGALLSITHDAPAAIEAYERAIELDPSNALAFCNYADALNVLGRHEDAARAAECALRLKPDYAQAHSNRGLALWAMGDLNAAIVAFRAAVQADPRLYAARMNLGMALLQAERWEEGWAEHDWRFAAEGRALRPSVAKVWDGNHIADGEIFVCGEQGLGDQILQASCLGDLVERGHEVVWECDPRLHRLFIRAYPTVRFIARAVPPAPASDPGPVAAQFPAASLPRFFRSSGHAFPERTGYLTADPKRVAEMVEKLGLAGGQKLIGLSWRSDAPATGAIKSADLGDFAPVRTSDARVVSLQYGADASGLALQGLDATNDLEGLAALISLCDAVVTVSNATAHLACALGVPTFVLIGAGRARIWYWGDRDVTPFYPTARIFRREQNEPWAVPIARAAAALTALLKTEA